MNIKEIRALHSDELIKQLAVLREQVRDLRFKIHSKEVKNSHQLTAIRRDIARILTVLNQEPQEEGK